MRAIAIRDDLFEFKRTVQIRGRTEEQAMIVNQVQAFSDDQAGKARNRLFTVFLEALIEPEA